MLEIKEYVKAESLEQAYELNQKRTNCILGGMLWLKMVTRNVQKAINLLIEEGFLSTESNDMIKKFHFYVDGKRLKSTAFQNKQNLREIYIFNQ